MQHYVYVAFTCIEDRLPFLAIVLSLSPIISDKCTYIYFHTSHVCMRCASLSKRFHIFHRHNSLFIILSLLMLNDKVECEKLKPLLFPHPKYYMTFELFLISQPCLLFVFVLFSSFDDVGAVTDTTTTALSPPLLLPSLLFLKFQPLWIQATILNKSIFEINQL